MSNKLVIVESPAKAKTIQNYLGKDFKVVSSMGHIRDLAKGDGAVDVENGYALTYQLNPDKKKVIEELKASTKNADTVYLASDDDREGEAISWHLKEVLKLTDEKAQRIVFTEITKKAIQQALESPRSINLDLVNAQQARRVLDRLVGFELSPILWKKIKTGLSAGRVQSVAVRLVVEREREIEKFEPTSSYKITALFDVGQGRSLHAGLSEKFSSEQASVSFLETCKQASFTLVEIEKKPKKKSPSPPFTTSTLQQEAARKLSFSVIQTMVVAQKLYEAGKISYMRTDSLFLSNEAVQNALHQISTTYGEEYALARKYKTKSLTAQEAHEAIRPTDFSVMEPSLDYNARRLYELIWKRAIASQMADAALEQTKVTIAISNDKRTFLATGERIVFEGFLKVYSESTGDEHEAEDVQPNRLPMLKKNQPLPLEELEALETYTRHPPRYAEASLVKKLEEMGIGRPSTYAPIISTVQKRGYVVKESREGVERFYKSFVLKDKEILSKKNKEITGTEKNKLFPTNTAMVVNDFLVHHFPVVTNYSFTADIEKDFDIVAKGKLEWTKMIDLFYKPFHATVFETEKVERSSVANKVRHLGEDPKTNLNVYVKLGRYGAYAQLGENEENEGDKKPKFSSLHRDQLIENITLEEALELFKLPREVGMFENTPLIANIGRFGAYILHEKKFTSIPKDEDPYTISADRAIELVEEKRKIDINKIIKLFDDNEEVQVLNGRFGPYIKMGKQNIKIPKDKKPDLLTLKECLELAEKAPEKKRSPAKKGKKTMRAKKM